MTKVRVNWGCLDDTEVVQLYCVYNSSHRHLYVLAKDKVTAMQIAHTANHIHGIRPIHADNYGRDVYAADVAGTLAPKDLIKHGSALERAIAERWQGTVHWDSGQLAVGFEVIEE